MNAAGAWMAATANFLQETTSWERYIYEYKYLNQNKNDFSVHIRVKLLLRFRDEIPLEY
jgi:hypothetical protein